MVRGNRARWRDIILVAVLLGAVTGAFLTVTRLPGPVVDRMVRTDVERHAVEWRDLLGRVAALAESQ